MLPPKLIQATGLAMFVFFCGFWAVTGKTEPQLLGGTIGLIAAGRYLDRDSGGPDR